MRLARVSQFFLIRDFLRSWGARVLVVLSISLGVSALVTLETFSRRIGASISQDTKKFLAADLQIQAFRAFDEVVLEAAKKLSSPEGIVRQTDLLSTLFLPNGMALNATLRFLDGQYPFYGKFRTDSAKGISDLAFEPSFFADPTLKQNQLKIGDYVEVGAIKLKLIGFIEEEPQTASTFFSLGPKIIIHQRWVDEIKLLGSGTRALRYLLIKTDIEANDFRKKFREIVPDPHWRVITPERANIQIQAVLQRLRSYLSLVALASLFLGAIGVFMMLRSHFLLKKEQWITLRCLGLSKADLRSIVISQSTLLAVLGSVVGFFLATLIESKLSIWAQALYKIEIAEVSLWPSFIYGLAVSLVCVMASLWAPLQEILRWPVAQAIQEQNSAETFKRRDLFPTIGVAVAFIFFVAGNVKLALAFLAALAATIVFLMISTKALLNMLAYAAKIFTGITRHVFLRITRKAAQFRLMLLSLGVGVFLITLLSIVSNSLKGQISLSRSSELPNLFLISVDENDRSFLNELVPASEWVPVTQARIKDINGKTIVEAGDLEVNEESMMQTREYTITRRSQLNAGERLLSGENIFSDKCEDCVRASVEERFSQRLKLKVGDYFKISIAGVDLKARIDSVRRVDWWNFRPNFFLVFNEDDLKDAPMNFVVFSRYDADKISSLQKTIMNRLPHVSAINGDSLSLRLQSLINRISQALYAVGFFSLLAALFVFLGLLISQRDILQQELSLLRCLGWGQRARRFLYIGEYAITALTASLAALTLSLLSGFLITQYLLQIDFVFPTSSEMLLTLAIPLLLFSLFSIPILEYRLLRKESSLFS